MDKEAIDSVQNLFEQWELYDSVIRHDYMHHQVLAAAIAEYGREHNVAGRALDLGCGDSYLAFHALGDLPLTDYAGVDLSESALARAQARWSQLPIAATFTQSDFATYLPGQPIASFDLVLGSYSIHHFSSERKRHLLGEIRRVLKPSGSFIWSDVVCDEGQTYVECVEQLGGAMRRDWNQLTARQLEMAIDHIRASDFPETEAWMIENAAAAGLGFDRNLMETPYFSAYAFLPNI